jgi:hypothetical protein
MTSRFPAATVGQDARAPEEVDMPVSSYVRGAEGWTPIGHKATRDDHRRLPVGPIHAAEPTAATAVCSGATVELDDHDRSFEPWSPGTCPACSEALAPRAAPTPPDARSR